MEDAEQDGALEEADHGGADDGGGVDAGVAHAGDVVEGEALEPLHHEDAGRDQRRVRAGHDHGPLAGAVLWHLQHGRRLFVRPLAAARDTKRRRGIDADEDTRDQRPAAVVAGAREGVKFSSSIGECGA